MFSPGPTSETPRPAGGPSWHPRADGGSASMGVLAPETDPLSHPPTVEAPDDGDSPPSTTRSNTPPSRPA